MFSGIDFFIVIVYLIGLLVLGTSLSRYVSKSGDYFQAGRRLPWWAIGMSLVAMDVGVIEWAGVAGGDRASLEMFKYFREQRKDLAFDRFGLSIITYAVIT